MIEIILIAAAVIYLIALLWLRAGLRDQSGVRTSSDLPAVTIVVSLHNEEKNLPSLIDCLQKLEYPVEKLEFILINDRSSDRTGEILENLAQMHQNFKIFRINEVEPDFAPKKRAIDLAIREALGEIILLTDADGRPGKDWVHAIVKYFSDDTGMVLGHAPYSSSSEETSFMIQLLRVEYFSHAAVAAATAGHGFPVTCVGTNLAYRKSVYLEIDGFGPLRHIHTGDDDLFLQRVRDETQWQIRYSFDPLSFVPNAPPGTWKQFYHQRLRYASKGFVYPPGITITLIAFYLFNLALFAILPACAFGGFTLTALLSILLIKLFADYQFLNTASTVFTFTLPGYLFPLASLLHIPYVLYFGFMANFYRFEWGGIKHRPGG